MRIEKNYVFTGFGFNVVIPQVIINSIAGEEYPDLDMNALKITTAKNLLLSKSRISGAQLSFLRTLMRLSLVNLSEMIDVPPSTISLWEKNSEKITGLTVSQERLLRLQAIEYILDSERDSFNKEIVKTEDYSNENVGFVELKV